MRAVVDLDGTLCSNTHGKYESAMPYWDMIEVINQMHDDGHYIIIRTARGMSCGNRDAAITRWYRITQNQLDDWGVKYDELKLGKECADVYIDDRAFVVNPDGSGADALRKFIYGS